MLLEQRTAETHRTFCGLAICAALLTSHAAHADPDPTTGTRSDERAFFGPAEFLEKSYLFYALPAPTPNPTSLAPDGTARDPKRFWLILEAQPALHFYFWNGLNHLIQNPKSNDGTWTFAPSFSFQSQIRFLTARSNPVRTPSFMPRFNFQLFRVSFPNSPLWPGSSSKIRFREVEIVVQVGHHSDGQEFCEYQAGHIDDGGCVPIDPKHPDYTKTNVINGTFGTSYFAAGAHEKLVTNVDGNGYASNSFSFGGLVQYNTSGILPGDLSPIDKELYGQWRLRVDVEFQRLTDLVFFCVRSPSLLGHFRTTASMVGVWQTGPGISPYQFSAEASRTFLQLGGAGLFARIFSGQDYYNINFVHRIDFQVQAGLIIDFATPLFFGQNRHPEWNDDQLGNAL